MCDKIPFHQPKRSLFLEESGVRRLLNHFRLNKDDANIDLSSSEKA